MADKPARGLADVVAASTALSDVDGVAGRLYYRGYDIHDLAGRTSFEETVHLLVRGSLPTRVEIDALITELAEARTIGASAQAVLPFVTRSGTAMEALRTLVSALSVDDPDASDVAPEADQPNAMFRVAQLPLRVAGFHGCRTGPSLPGLAGFFGMVGD